ncbi:MAG: hypothetical protein GY940_45225 [bacterium]|nr:hypothetical protein [bacterium]
MKKHVILLIAVLSLMVFSIACSGSKQPGKKQGGKAIEPMAKDGGIIFYSSGPRRSRQLHSISPNGSQRRQLLTGATRGDYSPNLSPDGKRLLFTTSRLGQWKIAITGVGGKEFRLLINPSPGYENAAAWAPDGKSLVFSSAPGPGQAIWQLFRANADGTDPRKIIDTQFQCFKPAFSPDGSRIAFERADPSAGYSDICLMNTDGSDILNLTRDKSTRDCGASWSPDGNTLAFISIAGGPRVNLAAVSRDGKNLRTIAADVGHYPGPGIVFYFRTCWKPDGKQIAYSAHDGNDIEIYRINPDGSGKENVTSNDIDDVHPFWAR